MREAEGARGKSTGRGVRENMQGDHLEVHRFTERGSDLLPRRESNALRRTDSDNRELNKPAYDRRVGSFPFKSFITVIVRYAMARKHLLLC